MSARVLAAITSGPMGGGVAAVSRLIWRVFEDRWPNHSRLMTLERGADAKPETLAARLAFGAELASMQIAGRCQWTLYSHLGIAQVQRYIPAPVARPYGVFLHGIEIWRPLTTRQRHVLENASLLLSNSAYTAKRVTAEHPWIGRIEPCPLALLPEESDLVPHSALHSASVLVVGRLDSGEQYKGHDQLIEAWPRVRRLVPNARLLIVGDGNDADRLKAKAAALNPEGAITFTGFVSPEQLAAAYRDAALLAMPSRNEGFGLVYLEAMRHGLPCIGSTHDAAGSVIADGVTGFLVDQADIATLADRIVVLLNDPAKRLAMGVAGQARLAREFSFDAFRSRLLGLLQTAFRDDTSQAMAESSATE